MSVKIIVDSSADMAEEVQNSVETVPLTVRFSDREYVDGVDIDCKTFYEMLIESDELPTTSQPSPEAFKKLFRTLKNGEQAVVITISSKLSGTYQSACIAAEDFPGIFVVDSGTTTVGQGIIVELALSLSQKGLSAKEIADRLDREKEKITVVALVDTLEYLKKGGRISKTAAVAGTVLNIKPVICLNDGVIGVLGKARGSKQGNNLLVREIEKSGGIDFSRPVMLGYTGISDALLLKYIEDSKWLWQERLDRVRYSQIGSVVGTHAGPGAVAVAFFKNK